MKLKVCGLTDKNNILEMIQEVNPDYLGFIFYEPSPRFVEKRLDSLFVKSLPGDINKTGVFVNSSREYILERSEKYGLKTLQLHGNEDPGFCSQMKSMGYEIIKVFRISESIDISFMQTYQEACDLILFDTAGKYKGGNGLKFNWELLNEYTLDQPYFLSGGISPGDEGIIRSIHDNRLFGVDINSRFELEKGYKNVLKIKQFSNAIKNQKDGETTLHSR
jgi:phosphoribosylanthranilate isomerase